jgi:RNA polymerase sigma-70 factor (TIGR02957 family)
MPAGGSASRKAWEVSDEPGPTGAELYDELRPAAFAIAYRMLGSVSEAEDAVQEGLLRLHRTLAAGERIESPRAYLAAVVTRLCIDELRSARVRRERYVGEWLPEPLVADHLAGRLAGPRAADPAEHAETADSLSLAFLVLLESLSPEQRAAFLLREVFDYPYGEIAAIVGKEEANIRQLVARARRHVRERRPRFEADLRRRDELAHGFFAAVQNGNLAALESLLAEDVVLHGDGGGKAPAIGHPLLGARRVAKTLQTWGRAGRRNGGAFRLATVNGQPGAVTLDAAGQVLGVMALDIADGRIRAVNSIVNPDKLRHVGPLGDLYAFMKPENAYGGGPETG